MRSEAAEPILVSKRWQPLKRRLRIPPPLFESSSPARRLLMLARAPASESVAVTTHARAGVGPRWSGAERVQGATRQAQKHRRDFVSLAFVACFCVSPRLKP